MTWPQAQKLAGPPRVRSSWAPFRNRGKLVLAFGLSPSVKACQPILLIISKWKHWLNPAKALRLAEKSPHISKGMWGRSPRGATSFEKTKITVFSSLDRLTTISRIRCAKPEDYCLSSILDWPTQVASPSNSPISESPDCLFPITTSSLKVRATYFSV